MKLGDFQKAVENARQCAQMRRRLVDKGPTLPLGRAKLNHVLKVLARAYERQGLQTKAQECYREAITVVETYHELTGKKQFEREIENLREKLTESGPK